MTDLTLIPLSSLHKNLVVQCGVKLVDMLTDAINDADELPNEIYAYHQDAKSGYGVRLALDISQLTTD